MSDDFGTVNATRGERARELELLRQRYRRHREALVNMTADAPTEHLATEYQRLIRDLDAALVKLDELEGGTAAAAPVAAPPANPQPRFKTEPGLRPLATSPESEPPAGSVGVYDPPPDTGGSATRVVGILIAAVVVLALIGWLIWRASSEKKTTPATIVEQPVAERTSTSVTASDSSGTSAVDDTIATPNSPPDVLTVTPASQDYGIVRKGTRTARQFVVTNHGDAPATIALSRSSCRCLFYKYNDLVPPNGKQSVTITIDGARAKPGAFHEALKITLKKDSSVAASLDVNATIR
ncbi:MAG: DUF1573 domain-containing protein [Acidobacteria bacterium]|nr:DUF1573 domain-containing protein [Acidobacteriota bacterium]MBV9474944.1 DUF1573 domain-containing protein [Acidobacteriota bacterium]